MIHYALVQLRVVKSSSVQFRSGRVETSHHGVQKVTRESRNGMMTATRLGIAS